ncbi:uncharacterized protein E5676_scaffold552G00130 [Cucumis melo var. makuwa]|uniref:Uncharacterized protein n=1 Tax=Cucumis melo var. makuwa TaxID=1194695 RepID=A0A5D3CU58_CUCMM|nr:uncharacterized protein E5676_scaffold552G00130 [Cucumis melo var. makuwa]
MRNHVKRSYNLILSSENSRLTLKVVPVRDREEISRIGRLQRSWFTCVTIHFSSSSQTLTLAAALAPLPSPRITYLCLFPSCARSPTPSGSSLTIIGRLRLHSSKPIQANPSIRKVRHVNPSPLHSIQSLRRLQVNTASFRRAASPSTNLYLSSDHRIFVSRPNRMPPSFVRVGCVLASRYLPLAMSHAILFIPCKPREPLLHSCSFGFTEDPRCSYGIIDCMCLGMRQLGYAIYDPIRTSMRRFCPRCSFGFTEDPRCSYEIIDSCLGFVIRRNHRLHGGQARDLVVLFHIICSWIRARVGSWREDDHLPF